ncbi:MAG TPA: oligosaccharide flippase family protein, partial [Candidatus Baltobacteraceae bacterium]|nr:oligosaccharide flippase family protein [Candidatus Baltobacteraceae bacterium]
MQIFKHWPIYIVGRILPAAIAFAGIAIYTRLLDPASFGTYALLLSTSFGIGLIGFSWIRLAALRMAATVAPADEPNLLATIGLAFGATSIAVTAVIVLVVRLYDPALGWTPVLLTAACAIASAWFELNVALMQARLRVVSYSLLQMARALGTLLASLGLVLAGLKAEALLAGFVIGNLAGFGGAGIWRPAIAGRFDRSLFRQIFNFGWPSSASSVSYLSMTFQRYALALAGGSGLVGIYAAAMDFSQQTIGLLMGTATLAGQPLAFRARDLGEQEHLSEQMRNNARLLFAVGLPAAAGLIALSGPISDVYLGPRFHLHAGTIMALGAAAMFLSGLRGGYFEQAFEITYKTRALAINAFLRVALVVAFSLWLIPRNGAIGAAVALLLSEVIGLLLSIVWARR